MTNSIKITFVFKDIDRFYKIVSMFKSVSNFLIIEFNNNNQLVFYNFTDQHTVLKVMKVKATDIFVEYDIKEEFVAVFFDIKKLYHVLKAFILTSFKDISLSVNYCIENDFNYAKSMGINNAITIHTFLACPKTIIAKGYKSHEKVQSYQPVFVITPTMNFWNELQNHMIYDTDDEIKFSMEDNKLLMTGKSLYIQYPGSVKIIGDDQFNLNIKKEYFIHLNNELFTLIGTDNGLVLIGSKSKAEIYIGKSVDPYLPSLKEKEEENHDEDDLFADDEEDYEGNEEDDDLFREDEDEEITIPDDFIPEGSNESTESVENNSSLSKDEKL